MPSTVVSGSVNDITLLRTECIVVLKDANGHASVPLPLPMKDNGNYNAMYSALILASANGFVVDLTSETDGVYIVKVHVR